MINPLELLTGIGVLDESIRKTRFKSVLLLGARLGQGGAEQHPQEHSRVLPLLQRRGVSPARRHQQAGPGLSRLQHPRRTGAR